MRKTPQQRFCRARKYGKQREAMRRGARSGLRYPKPSEVDEIAIDPDCDFYSGYSGPVGCISDCADRGLLFARPMAASCWIDRFTANYIGTGMRRTDRIFFRQR